MQSLNIFQGKEDFKSRYTEVMSMKAEDLHIYFVDASRKGNDQRRFSMLDFIQETSGNVNDLPNFLLKCYIFKHLELTKAAFHSLKGVSSRYSCSFKMFWALTVFQHFYENIRNPQWFLKAILKSPVASHKFSNNDSRLHNE